MHQLDHRPWFLALLRVQSAWQLGDTLVEASQLLDELRILTEKLCELSTLVRILLSQRFQLVHRRVQITLGDLCRSSSLFFEPRPPVPAAARCGEVDAGQERGEGRAVDRDLRLVAVERRQRNFLPRAVFGRRVYLEAVVLLASARRGARRCKQAPSRRTKAPWRAGVAWWNR